MTGKRRRKSKPKSDAITDSRSAEVKNENMEVRNWFDLPVEVLELILSRLTLEDNVRASVVCKIWHSVATAVRILNQSPWLMTFPKFGDCYEYYDPMQGKSYSHELPELSGSRACYSKEGWLLLYHPRHYRMFFFNPFTREVIELPRFIIGKQQIVCFSCAPTSPGCVVFTIRNGGAGHTAVTISTCYPGATRWTTSSYYNNFHLPSHHHSNVDGNIWNTLVFCNGLFYCLTRSGWVGVFDPTQCTWSVLKLPPPKPPHILFANTLRRIFMTEQDGEILVIYTCSHSGLNPMIYKLDQTLMEWEEITTLDGGTLFVGFVSSLSRTSLPTIMRNNVYFPIVRLCDIRCISFSLDDRKYHPCKQWHDWSKLDPLENIWIEPPKDFSTFK